MVKFHRIHWKYRRFASAVARSGLQLLEKKRVLKIFEQQIFELNLHGRPDVNLQAEQPFQRAALLVPAHQHAHEAAVIHSHCSPFCREEFDLGVLKLDFHLRAGMLLESDDARFQSAGVFINHLGENMVVDLNGEMRTVGDDD